MVKIETAMTKAEIENAYMDCLEMEQKLTVQVNMQNNPYYST